MKRHNDDCTCAECMEEEGWDIEELEDDEI